MDEAADGLLHQDLLDELLTDETDIDDAATGFISGRGRRVTVFFASPSGEAIAVRGETRDAIEAWCEHEGFECFFEDTPN